jgi:hypothetical protein
MAAAGVLAQPPKSDTRHHPTQKESRHALVGVPHMPAPTDAVTISGDR